jgi:hypothetical protein
MSVSPRPFGQPPIAAKDARLEPFQGRAFRYYLLLPRYRQGAEVFTALDAADLFTLLTLDFGGCTRNVVEQAPVVGSWEMREVDQQVIALDFHAEFTVYTRPTRTCDRYFARLEHHLRQHLWGTRGLHEEQILLERLEVTIIRGAARLRRSRPWTLEETHE